MSDSICPDLTRYAKALENFTERQEQSIVEIGMRWRPRLAEVTESFYEKLLAIPETAKFLEGRVDRLKKAHPSWLEQIFSGPYDESYTAYLYNVGDMHVRVNLPVEFMAAGTTLIAEALRKNIIELQDGDFCRRQEIVDAVNGALIFSLIAMQKSYQNSVNEQLDKYLEISWIGHALYQNMARAYKGLGGFRPGLAFSIQTFLLRVVYSAHDRLPERIGPI